MSVLSVPFLRIAVAAVAFALAMAGCGGAVEETATEAAIEAASGGEAEVDVDGNRTVIRTAEGELTMTSGDDVELPADYPDDVYLPEDYRVVSVIDNSTGGRAVALATDGTVEQVLADVRRQMQGHGWQQAMAMQNPKGQVVSFEKDERVAMLVLTPTADDEVRIGMTLMSSQ